MIVGSCDAAAAEDDENKDDANLMIRRVDRWAALDPYGDGGDDGVCSRVVSEADDTGDCCFLFFFYCVFATYSFRININSSSECRILTW